MKYFQFLLIAASLVLSARSSLASEPVPMRLSCRPVAHLYDVKTNSGTIKRLDVFSTDIQAGPEVDELYAEMNTKIEEQGISVRIDSKLSYNSRRQKGWITLSVIFDKGGVVGNKSHASLNGELLGSGVASETLFALDADRRFNLDIACNVVK